MTGLADVYEGQVGLAVSRRRLYLGLGLFFAGAFLTALGVVLAATGLRTTLGLAQMAAWRRAGVLAGLGVPAVIGGVFTILPSSDRVKAAATVGAGVSVLGVALFWYAYPQHWAGYGQNLTLPVTVVYFLGMTTSVWCLFVGIANFKRRNDPGGTVTLEVLVGDGETRTVEVTPGDLDDGTVSLDGRDAGGTVGVFGGTPDATAETQTNTPTARSSSDDGATVTTASASPAASSGGPSPNETASTTTRSSSTTSASTSTTAPTDGGVEDDEVTRPRGGDGQVISSADHAKAVADRYCGNCEHFQYVRTDEGMQPYCGFHDELMDDMEACGEWSPNH